MNVPSLESIAEALARREAVAKEYGKYRANRDIDAPNGAHMFNRGDPVPVTHVDGAKGVDPVVPKDWVDDVTAAPSKPKPGSE